MKGIDIPPALEAQAAKWLGQRDRGFTPQEQAAFDQWLKADPSHPSALAEMERSWITLDKLSASAAASGEPDPNALAPLRRPYHWVAPSILAAAAAVALLIFLKRPVSPSLIEERPRQDYATFAGGHARVTLMDGSVVELNGATAIHVQFTATERLVRLAQGEANFQVAKNPGRPFIVTANSVAVRAIGTAFDVCLHPDTVEVLVTEGKVGVERVSGVGPQNPRTPLALSDRNGTLPEQVENTVGVLTAGHRIVVPTAGNAPFPAAASLSETEISHALVWQQRLDLEETSLTDLVDQFNRHNSRKLVIAGPELGAMRISGSFSTDNEDAFVRLLESTFGVTVDRDSPDCIVLRKEKQK